jgi:hypothetical protein
MKPRHWFTKIKRGFHRCRPVRLSPGEVASLWRCLYDCEVDTEAQADLHAANDGRFREKGGG